jgi:hypothetical protein
LNGERSYRTILPKRLDDAPRTLWKPVGFPITSSLALGRRSAIAERICRGGFGKEMLDYLSDTFSADSGYKFERIQDLFPMMN